jgi:formimidoylglutamate deiminase
MTSRAAVSTLSTLWAPRAWLPGGWADAVLLGIGPDGCWASVTPGVTEIPPGSERLPGPLLPGLVDAHSHAFQRAFAGLAERREAASDDFWSWRDRMYGVALRITPEPMRAIAAQLYAELLLGGYTQVCEFHYLQHQPDGQPYPDTATMAWALADAAAEAGIGLTLMPVLYERAGFRQASLRPDQRRFATDAEAVIALADAIQRAGRPGVGAGLAIHSLRAAAPESIHHLARQADRIDGPIHIHVAEQTGEVDDCLAATGCRPIEWLAREGLLDARWQLVHATHTVPAEIDAVARSGAGVVICPTTEANLGDGFPDLPGWLDAGVPLSIGSDSHVTRDSREELRWLEYAQRLVRRQRNVAADPQGSGGTSTAARLWQRVQAGGAAAMAAPAWGVAVGARADAVLPATDDASLLGVPASHGLDAWVFSSPGRPCERVMVAGRWVVRDGTLVAGAAGGAGRIAGRFEAAMREIWQTG